MSKEENFQFKGGLFTLTLLQLKSVDLHLLEKGLKRKIAQSPAFFDQIPVIVDLEAIDTRDLLDLIWLKNLLVNLSIIPVALQNVPKHLLERAKNADWAILNDLKYQPKSLEESIEEPEKTEELATAVHSSERLESIPCETGLTTTQIRSGQQLYQEKGDMIVVNTVNVGAEILADGNIHIYGALRGRALAGVNGNRDARIFCQSLEAELVSIAGKYRVIEEFSAEWKGRAVQIYLDNDELKIEPLN